MPASADHLRLLLCVLVAVVGLIVAVAKLKLPAFIALILASLFVGVISGLSWADTVRAFQDGVGTMLGTVAIIVGLGMVLGKLLSESGGAQLIATTLIGALGQRRLPWTLLLIGFVIGIPVFFTVGVVLLVPVVFSILKQTRQPVLSLAIPVLAGLSVAHGLVPPHPGAMAAIGIIHADPGKTLLFSLLIGFPTAALAGPLLGRVLAARIPVKADLAKLSLASAPERPRNAPGFLLSLTTILLPVVLMLMAALADFLLSKGSPTRDWLDLMGHPVVALLLATLFAFYSFGIRRGFGREQLLRLAEDSLGPAGAILLVVGAGGGFNRVLVTSGVGDALASTANSLHLSPIILGWTLAALIRVATGSATVAITTASGMVAPLAARLPGTNLELLVLATGAGSLILSHVNDGGFWFVKEYLGLTVSQTLQSWTVLETAISLIALGLVLLLNCLI